MKRKLHKFAAINMYIRWTDVQVSTKEVSSSKNAYGIVQTRTNVMSMKTFMKHVMLEKAC